MGNSIAGGVLVPSNSAMAMKLGAKFLGKLKKTKQLKQRPKKFQAPMPPNGTGHNYDVFQNPNIDWHTKIRGKTNLQRAKKGRAPLIKDGNRYRRVEIHHFNQQGKGPLYELSSKHHDTSGLHPFGRSKNPTDPVNRELFAKDRRSYWRNRASQVPPP